MSAFRSLCIAMVAVSIAAALTCEPSAFAQTKQLPVVRAGTTGSLDAVALVLALENGLYEEQGIDGKLAPVFPTGVETLNALQSGNIDIAITGNPAIGALMAGMDIVYLAPHAGIANRARVDENMVMVARKDSGIDPNNPATLKGKKFGTTIGGAPHGYLSGLFRSKDVKLDEVTLVNISPPDMGIALQTNGVDAVAVWDPWVGMILRAVPGTYQAFRSGGHVASVGFILARREWVEKNPNLVRSFLLAYDKGTQWTRTKSNTVAEVETRWLPGTSLDIASEAIPMIVKTSDPRVSACLLLGLEEVYDFAVNVQKRTPVAGFNLESKLRPEFQLAIQKERPELFSDLPKIADAAALSTDTPTAWKTWDREAAKKVCGS